MELEVDAGRIGNLIRYTAVWRWDGTLLQTVSRQLADGSMFTVYRWWPPGAEL